MVISMLGCEMLPTTHLLSFCYGLNTKAAWLARRERELVNNYILSVILILHANHKNECRNLKFGRQYC